MAKSACVSHACFCHAECDWFALDPVHSPQTRSQTKRVWLMQGCFYMHDSQGKLAMHVYWSASISHMKGMQVGHSCHLGAWPKSRLFVIVEWKEQAEMHVREKLVHEEARTWWHMFAACYEALEDIPLGSLSVKTRRNSPQVQLQSQRQTRVWALCCLLCLLCALSVAVVSYLLAGPNRNLHCNSCWSSSCFKSFYSCRISWKHCTSITSVDALLVICQMCEIRPERFISILLVQTEWCAITGARQFLQPTYGKATENKSAHNTSAVNTPVVIAFVLLMDMICVFRPKQPQTGDGWTWHASSLCGANTSCVVNHNTGSNGNNNQRNNDNSTKLDKIVWWQQWKVRVIMTLIVSY